MTTNSQIKQQESPATQAQNSTIIFAVPEPAQAVGPSASQIALDCLKSCQLSPAAHSLGVFLARHARYATEDDRRRRAEVGEIIVYWPQSKLAAKRKKSLRQISREVRSLRQAGLEVRKRPRRGATYVFIPRQGAPAESFQTTRKATGRAKTQENQVCSARFKHSWCDGQKHVPNALHQEFARLAPSGFDLVAWYGLTDQAWSDKAIGDDSFVFWRARWKERFGSTRADERANQRLARTAEVVRSAFPDGALARANGVSSGVSCGVSSGVLGGVLGVVSEVEEKVPNKKPLEDMKREIRSGEAEQYKNLSPLQVFQGALNPKKPEPKENPMPGEGKGQVKIDPKVLEQAEKLKAKIEAARGVGAQVSPAGQT